MASEEINKTDAQKADAQSKPVQPPNPAKEKLKKTVYTIFSDRVMIILAVIAIPVIAVEFVAVHTSTYYYIAYALDWLIWIAFFLEFTLKVYVETDKLAYINHHKLDSTISIVIILSPLIGVVTNAFSALPVLRLIRITRLVNVARATQAVKITRTAAYTGNAVQKELKPTPRQDSFVISRTELRQVLTALGIKERDINNLTTALDKAHRHTNIIIFANLLEKLGIDRDKMGNVFRRMGMDDVTISSVFRMVDESKISAETGRLYDASIDFTVE